MSLSRHFLLFMQSVCLLPIVAVFGTLSSAVFHARVTWIFFADQDGYSSIVTPEFT